MSGCSAPAEPAEPTPLFTSEEQAFAAAEETYRAYVEALNGVDLSDPETFEDVYAWTTGEANANERKTMTQMHADGWAVSGDTVVRSFDASEASSSADVVAVACTDVTAVAVVDSDGASVVPSDRPNAYAVQLEFIEDSNAKYGLLISASNAIEDGSCS